MSSPVRQANSSEKSVASFADASRPSLEIQSLRFRGGSGLAAFSFEFVAKPEQAASAWLFLPAAIHSGLQDLPGFAGSLVMVSDQEARLITVVIFWNGSEVRKHCAQGLRRVRALLAPYLDRSLRVQTMVARLPTPQDSQVSSIDRYLIASESVCQEPTLASLSASY